MEKVTQILQLDNGLRSSVGFTITPDPRFAFRIYGDLDKSEHYMAANVYRFCRFQKQ